MNESDISPGELDALLRANAPAPLDDDGFVARTLEAAHHASHSMTPRHTPAASRLEIARALAVEQRRYAAHARVRRWGLAGVAAGFVLLAFAMAMAPGGIAIDVDANAAAMPNWFPLWSVLAVGALWYAWQEFRAD
ncbi:MAG: hypothetical protein ABJD97_06030 [Betaproteobacteria bacterium]